MKRFIIREGVVWIALVALTVLGFVNSHGEGHGVAVLVMALAFMKFALIYFDFMEMKHAHRAWQAAGVLFMVGLFSAIAFSL